MVAVQCATSTQASSMREGEGSFRSAGVSSLFSRAKYLKV